MKAQLLISLVVSVVLTGCATRPQLKPVLLDFLRDGATARQEVLQKLGPSSGRFNGDKILTYRAEKGENGYHLDQCPARTTEQGWQVWCCGQSLVLVFDDNDVLQRHMFVNVMKEDRK